MKMKLIDFVKIALILGIISLIIRMEKCHQVLLKIEYEVLKKNDYCTNPTIENLGDLRL